MQRRLSCPSAQRKPRWLSVMVRAHVLTISRINRGQAIQMDRKKEMLIKAEGTIYLPIFRKALLFYSTVLQMTMGKRFGQFLHHLISISFLSFFSVYLHLHSGLDPLLGSGACTLLRWSLLTHAIIQTMSCWVAYRWSTWLLCLIRKILIINTLRYKLWMMGVEAFVCWTLRRLRFSGHWALICRIDGSSAV